MRFLGAALAVALLLVACREGTEQEIPSEVTGVIIDVESSGFNQVESFILKDGEETYEIFTADDVDYGFPLGHLSEHLTTADPVRVTLEDRDGKATALSIDDA